MATNSYKATPVLREIRDELTKRLPTLAVTDGFDSADNYPYFSLGSGVAGTANVIVKLSAVTWPLAKDIFGNVANVYTPLKAQIITEANPAGGAGADPDTSAVILATLGTVLARGSRTEWWQSASGVAPALTTLNTASNLKASYDSLYFPLTGSM